MEIGLREWLVIGGIILIALIVLDGWRRMRSNKAQLRMKIDRQLVAEYSDEPDDSFNPELPNGGARVIGDQVDFFEERHHIEPTFDTNLAFDNDDGVGVEPKPQPVKPKKSRKKRKRSQDDEQTPMAQPDLYHNDLLTDAVEDTFKESDQSQLQEEERDPLFADPGSMPELKPEFSAAYQDEPLQDSVTSEYVEASPLSAEEVDSDLDRTEDIPTLAEESLAESTEQPDQQWDNDQLDFSRPISQLMDPAESDVAAPAAQEHGEDQTPELAELSDLEPPALDRQMPPLITDALSMGGEQPNPEHQVAELIPDFDELPGGDAISAARPVTPPSEQSLEPEAVTQEPEPAVVDDPRSEEIFPEAPEVEAISSPEMIAQPDQEQGAKDAASSSRRALSEAPDPENVLVITVVAGQDKPISGRVLHKLVDACGMQHGDMDIYHRFEEGRGQGPVQFSMANAVSPGSFDLATLDSLQTPAVSFFMSMEEPCDVMNAYECMLATAETVAKHMGAELLDENRSVMRPQTKQHYRQRIRDFEMHKRTRRSV